MDRIVWSEEVADRAAGVLLGQAFGDALGAPYEFGPPLGGDEPVDLVGGGAFGWAPGEWTDDTQMAVAVLETAEDAARDGVRLVDRLDALVGRWVDWSRSAADVGAQTRRVLDACVDDPTAGAARAAADALHERFGRSGGNGSLMRTAPVALAHLDDVDAMVEAARAVSALTHHDPEAGDACVLWCAAIRHAALTGEADVRVGLALVPTSRRPAWEARIADAEQRGPASFAANGWVVEAFGAAWSAVVRTPGHGPGYVRSALECAVRGGADADTVAAIAGALVGARSGATAVRAALGAPVHGWPGLTGDDLARRGAALAAPRG
ncbi:ADP-ribosylglycohydrolase family protein [Cellulomonas sp. SLBN-39]|uniref:ADP-ribosylglycohydrolase family protein n=1 Tax=Cellulomonas sp. SLBN-39 TaxID=2768446 RepID=UPI0021057D9D|nr:ADP-ribosylglycohydrolase family protein [Cellulomonas sp. SLBN-39]